MKKIKKNGQVWYSYFFSKVSMLRQMFRIHPQDELQGDWDMGSQFNHGSTMSRPANDFPVFHPTNVLFPLLPRHWGPKVINPLKVLKSSASRIKGRRTGCLHFLLGMDITSFQNQNRSTLHWWDAVMSSPLRPDSLHLSFGGWEAVSNDLLNPTVNWTKINIWNRVKL